MAYSIAHVPSLRSAGGGWLALAATGLLLIGAQASAQDRPPAPPPASFAPPASPPQPAEPPATEAPRKPANALEAFGRWWEDSAAQFKQSVDDSNAKWRQSVEESNAKWRQSVEENNAKWRQSVDDLNARNEKAAKDAAAAAEAFGNLSKIRMVEGRQVCETAANGAPDCQTAAEIFCKSKGFTTGKSADITTTRKCSARSLIRRESYGCKVETVMIKAACQ